MTSDVNKILEATLQILKDEFVEKLHARGLVLRESSIDKPVVHALYADDVYKLLVGVDFHDHSIVIYFLPLEATLESSLLLHRGVYLGEVIVDSMSPTKKQDLKIINREINPYKPELLIRRIREICPILLQYLSAGKQAIVTSEASRKSHER